MIQKMVHVRNAIYIQSGGPTSVINSSAAGVITGLQSIDLFKGRIYVPLYGLLGIIKNQLKDITDMSAKDIELLKKTPSMAFGSTRYEVNQEEDFNRFIKTLKMHSIYYIYINGGNGSVHFAKKLSKELENRNYDFKLVVIPKTVDNDISGIHHSPGFPSAARHVVQTVMELFHDMQSYDSELIVVAEVMGRNSGWIAASTIAAKVNSCGPDLIYVPEREFDLKKFVEDINKCIKKKRKCFVIFSEGVKLGNGKHLFEINNPYVVDSRKNMGGISTFLNHFLNENFDCKVRVINLDLMQRSAMHNASEIDKQEAYELGYYAVKKSVDGQKDIVVTHEVLSSNPYEVRLTTILLDDIDRESKMLDHQYICHSDNFIDDSYLDYIRPLIGTLPNFIDYKNVRKEYYNNEL